MRKPQIRKERVMEALETIMELRRCLMKDCTLNNLWKHNEALQAYRDCLESFKRSGVIADYNLETGVINYEEKTKD
jgi:hypothetical protein